MLKNLTQVFFAFFALCCITSQSFALPLPDGGINRQQAIDTYFKDKPDNLLEGIWITEDNQFEIAIVKNNFLICEDYDYIGFTVHSTDANWERGKVKLQLKSTAIPKFYVGYWHKKQSGYQTPTEDQSLGTSFRISPANNNLLEYLNEKKERKALYRVYPGNTEDSKTYTHSGTGFFIAPDLIVTNYHVIADCETVIVKYNNDESVSAAIAAKDTANDLALLKVDKIMPSIIPLSLGNIQNANESDAVYTLGFPLTSILGTNPKLSQGIINSLTGIKDDVRMFQVSLPIQPGNSGGPLLNAKGEVIGVVSGTINPLAVMATVNTFPQNINYAVKINYLNNLLTTLKRKPLPIKKSGAELTPREISILAKNAVVRVQAK